MKKNFENYIKDLIKVNGPISIAQFMSEHINSPKYNYYKKNTEKIGAKGDFVTSPEISQIFGELIGLWCANIWWAMNSPKKFNLIELGPGNGTLMKDALRALAIVPDFLKYAEIHLVESSNYLKTKQIKKLKNEFNIFWHKDISSIPNHPNIIISNEFLDTFPIHQYELTKSGWAERYIGLDKNDNFYFIHQLINKKFLEQLSSFPLGSIFEYSPSLNSFFESITIKLKSDGGFALFIDYGYDEQIKTSTLRSIINHEFVDIFEHMGNTDLSAHVNFGALKSLSKKFGVYNYGIVTQGSFLNNLGISHRVDKLLKTNPEYKEEIINANFKLTNKKEMGEIFKVLAISEKLIKNLPGF